MPGWFAKAVSKKARSTERRPVEPAADSVGRFRGLYFGYPKEAVLQQTNRRQFLVLAGATACACVFGPEVATADAPAAEAVLEVGTLADYPRDGVYDALAKRHKVLVIRHGDRLYAATALCTHKRQTLRVKEGQLGCPAHSSKFDLEGRPTAGPAKSPLVRFAISKREDGRLVVDKSRMFAADKWDEPEAFVKL
jgi:nitrite reductase/ring-hydroxylating ferredoxin subunit